MSENPIFFGLALLFPALRITNRYIRAYLRSLTRGIRVPFCK